MSGSPPRAAWLCALVLAAGAARAITGLAVGGPARPLLMLAAAELALAGLVLVVPWDRLPRDATLVVLVPGFPLMAVSGLLGQVPDQALGVPFVVVFAWIGAYHRRGASTALAPVAALAYAVPLADTVGALEPRALVLTLGACVLVGETIAASAAASGREHARAEAAARAFGVVARASAALQQLDPQRVLDAVPAAVVELGYDSARLVEGAEAANAPGVVGQAWRTGEPALAPAGGGAGVAVPVFSGRSVGAVLEAACSGPRLLREEDVEALRVLAATAGIALENAEQFVAERSSAERHAVAALTDPLTGVGNRRRAQQLLDRLQPGDCLLMVDLDRFKQVNDRLGHAAGDQALRDLAAHLTRGLRAIDAVTRLGGEEFLVVLVQVDAVQAQRTVARLVEGWRASRPTTTFSCGLAHHLGGSAEVTLEKADRALYQAKQAGRDTWRPQQSVPSPRAEGAEDLRLVRSAARRR